MKWIKLSDTQSISAEPMHFNKTFEEQKASLKKNESIASYELLQKLRNSKKYPDSFTDFWVRVFPNPDLISERNNYVAGFGAISVGADLCCYGDADGRYDALGVFVVRKKLR